MGASRHILLESSLFLTVVEARSHHGAQAAVCGSGGRGSSPLSLCSLDVGLCGQGHPIADGWSLVQVVK